MTELKEIEKNNCRALDEYLSDYDFADFKISHNRAHKFYSAIMANLINCFRLNPPSTFKVNNSETSYVRWHHFRGDAKNKWAHGVVIGVNGSFVVEYCILHEIAHLVEHHFYGRTTNRHGKKFQSIFKALKIRYNLTNKI